MNRGNLRKQDIEMINNRLPSIKELSGLIVPLNPVRISDHFPHNSSVPVASVCLKDSYRTLAEARYALQESMACKIWYSQNSKKYGELSGDFFGKYYLDDAALRIYSSGEHLANAIIKMMEITDNELNKYKDKASRESLQKRVSKFLTDKMPAHPITTALAPLKSSSNFKKTIEYRNDWVHDQPPLVKSKELSYKREKRWEKIDSTTYEQKVWPGDEPQYKIQELQEIFLKALQEIIRFTTSCVNAYLDILSKRGIKDGKTTVFVSSMYF